MILKRIEIFGFKSFGNKTAIDFNDRITAIVGPNGSGKSNIVDAVKWVIGEQRVKTLRGGKMEDIIFSGNDEKKALGYAQVTLLLDNSSKFFPLDFEEISISRRLFRSGESEYYINKALCRLKDITDLFTDTGLGREGYSIIGQGQIESLVNNSPFERKLMLEEAVGIVKYKTKKLEAERKLERAKTNLYRITDIITEIEARLPSLKRQSDKAEKYVEYRNKLKDIEVGIFVRRMDKLNVELEKANADKNAIEESIRLLDEELAANDEKYQNLKQSVGSFDKKLSVVNEQMHKLIGSFENSKTEIALSKAKTEECKNELLANDEAINELTLKAQECENNLKSIKEELDQTMKSATAFENSLARTKIMAGKTFDIKEFVERTDLTESESALKNKLSKATVQLAENKKRYEENKDNLASVYSSVQILQAKLAMLNGYEENMQGYHYGVKKLSELRRTDAILRNGLYGAIGELITVKEEYSEAISKALAGAVEYMLTDNERTASHCIELLKQNKWGRVTFLPQNIIKKNEPANASLLRNMEGFIGFAAELVTYNKEYYDVISNLLGRVVVAKNLSLANTIAKKTEYRYKIVTIEGDVIYAGGAMTGGNTKTNDDNALARKAQIEKLTSEIALQRKMYDEKLKLTNEFSEKVFKTEELLEELKNEASTLNTDRYIEELSKVNDIEKSLIVEKEKILRISERYDNEKERAAGYKNEVIRLTEKCAQLNEQQFSEKQKIEYYTAIDRDYDKMRADLENEYESLSKAKEDANKNYIAANDRIVEVSGEKNVALEKLNKAEMLRQRAQIESEHLIENMMEDYSLTYQDAQVLKVGVADLEVSIAEATALREKISRLGNINVDALNEYKELKMRYDNMTEQRDDLLEAKEELNKIIVDMSKSMVAQFIERFEMINAEFNSVFGKLFKNGQARLVLTDPDNIIETGIEIEAKPNTNKLKNISALSGGEKTMTGIALIFAILKIKPSPFCILDEIDAALDEVNVAHLCDYLLSVSKNNQFIVITHKKRSMEIADSLYGTTMGKEGITKLISVKFSEITNGAEND